MVAAKKIKTRINLAQTMQTRQQDEKSTDDPPKISLLMATAIRFEEMIESGLVSGFAELADLTGLSKARISQIMNLRLLAPSIQEEILFLTSKQNELRKITERKLRPIVQTIDWSVQLEFWRVLTSKSPS